MSTPLSAEDVAAEMGINVDVARHYMATIGRGYERWIPSHVFRGWLTRSKGLVYFAYAPAAGLVKIGHTDNIKRRMKGLRAMSPLPLELLGTTPGSVMVEREYHAEFAKLRAHGEWFWLKDDLLHYLNAQGCFP